jgi:hypothetical protein
MRKVFVLLSITIALSACATTRYTKEGATSDQADYDRQACMQQGEIAVGSLNSDNPFDVGMRKITIADNCMRLKGYTPAG